MSFMESHAFGAAASRIVERSLSAEVIRLQKLRLDEALSRSVEEAERLVNIGRYCEAEALLQNADARLRHRETAGLSNTPWRTRAEFLVKILHAEWAKPARLFLTPAVTT